MTRRLAVQFLLAAAGEFWNRKPPGDWTEEEVARLLRDSPWAKDVNADFDTDAEPSGPTIGRGGVVGAPSGRTRRREPVVVIWETAAPIVATKHLPLGPQFAGRYVLSAGEIPIGAMERRGATGRGESPLERRQRMVAQLTASARLEAKGKPPVQPGVVEPAARMPATWLFGFSRELLALDRDDSEVVFTLETAFVTLRAKFEPKKMLFDGKLAI